MNLEQARFPAARGGAHSSPPHCPRKPPTRCVRASPPNGSRASTRCSTRYVNDGRIGGVVALVLRDGKPVYERAVGWSDSEAGRKMTMDTEFRIASQSKALTSVAILQLMEEGKLTVNDRAGKYIPTFEQTSVLTRVENSTTWTTVAAKRPITIKDLLTHTAGINYGQEPGVRDRCTTPKGLGPAAGFGWYFADKDEPICTTMERLGTLPFESQPGEALRVRLQHRRPGLHRRKGVRRHAR